MSATGSVPRIGAVLESSESPSGRSSVEGGICLRHSGRPSLQKSPQHRHLRPESSIVSWGQIHKGHGEKPPSLQYQQLELDCPLMRRYCFKTKWERTVDLRELASLQLLEEVPLNLVPAYQWS